MATTTHPHFLAVDRPVRAQSAVFDEAEPVHHPRAPAAGVHNLFIYDCYAGQTLIKMP